MTPVRFGVHDRVGEPVAVGVGPAERVQKLVQQNVDPVAFPGDTGVVEQHAGGQYHAGLVGDRIARVVRSPDAFAVEHDAGSGDLYLRPSAAAARETGGQAADPVTLFIGTEKGFTYRLTLTPADRARRRS